MASRAAETVGDVIRYLDPGAIAGPGPVWPPDAFAIAATILKRSGAYRKVANVWPPARYDDTNAWHDATTAIADEWRATCDASAPAFPLEVQNWWNTVVGKESAVLPDVLDDVNLFESLVALVAVCDSACRSFGFDESGSADAQQRANRNLSLRQSLCEAIHPSHCVVLPKAHNPVAGMTLRSLTHNLALWDKPEVSARWENIDLAITERTMNLLLVPWPLHVDPDSFHETIDCHELRLPNRVGLFDYDISFTDADIAKVRSLVDRAKAEVGTIDGIVFPELAMSLKQFAMVREAVQDALSIPLLISGVGGANPDKLGTNNVAISVYAGIDEPYRQGKHHRWRLDEGQCATYGVTGLPAKPDNGAWWEGVEIENRSCFFFNANDWLTFCVLICEDLARLDPVSELVRSVGPSLVIALLLDGPQVRGRWPDRYATVLAEDPRSSVLTLTSAGMVDLSNGTWTGAEEPQRSIALWRDAHSGQSRPILLEDGREGVVLHLQSRMIKEWTADGRHDHGKTGYLALEGVRQVGGP